MTHTKFGRYDLLERIGTSEVAEIYKARSLGAAGFEKIVAIKRIQPLLEKDEEFVRLFTEEARISASLTHASIAQVIEFGRIDDAHYLAMEYLNGMDLARLLAHFAGTGKVMPLPLALHIAHAVAGALAYAHSRSDSTGKSLGILHLGVNPQNILVSFEGAVKLTDFGIGRARARLPDAESDRAERLAYMSPEQLAGDAVDERSDVFSLGCVLYACAVGQAAFPWAGDDTIEERPQKDAVVAPRQVDASIPPQAEEIILRALAGEPEARYRSASELERAIETFAHQARMTFNAKQLARWMQSHFPATKRTKSPASPPGDAAPTAEPRPRAASRSAAARPGAVAAPLLVRGQSRSSSAAAARGAGAHSLLRGRGAPPNKQTLPPRPLRSTAPGRVEPSVGEVQATSPRQPATAAPSPRRLAKTRMGLGSPVAEPADSAHAGAAIADPRDDSGLSTLDSDLVQLMPSASGTVNLTEADLQEAEVDDLSLSNDDNIPGDVVPSVAAVEASVPAAQRDQQTIPDGPPRKDAAQLLREVEALQWDDGPTILDPRENESLESSIPAIESAELAVSEFVVADDGVDMPTRVEAVPAALLAETLVDGSSAAEGAADDSLAADGDSAAPDIDAESPSASPQQPAPAAIAATPAARREGLGILLPALAIVSLILLVAGAVLVYVLLTDGSQSVVQPSVRVIPATDDEQNRLPTRALADEPAQDGTGRAAAADTKAKAGSGATAATPEKAAAQAHKPKAPTKTVATESDTPSAAAETPDPESPKPGQPGPEQPSVDAAVETAKAASARPDAAVKTDRIDSGGASKAPATNQAKRSRAPAADSKKPAARPTEKPKEQRQQAIAPRRTQPRRTEGGTSSRQPRKRPERTRARRTAKPSGPAGYLIVASRPKAKVLVDGRSSGRESPIRPSNPLKLSPGKHRVTLVAQGKKFHYTISVKPQQTTRLVRVLPLP